MMADEPQRAYPELPLLTDSMQQWVRLGIRRLECMANGLPRSHTARVPEHPGSGVTDARPPARSSPAVAPAR